MDTDSIFYELFREHPDWLRDFTGLPLPEGCKASSQTFKQLEIRCDLLLEPLQRCDPHYIIEFQLYHDYSIFNRIEMARQLLWKHLNKRDDCRRKSYQPAEIETVIIFGDREDLPANRSRHPLTEVLFFDELVEVLRNKNPNSPLIAALSPVCTSAKDLEKDASSHYDLIRNAEGLEESDRDILVEIFVNLLLQRFKTKSLSEIRTMIAELTPIKETRAGAELFEEGIEKGLEEGIEKGIGKVVRKMSEKGKSKQEIAELTDLDPAEIDRLLSDPPLVVDQD